MNRRWTRVGGTYLNQGREAARCTNAQCANPMNAAENAEGSGAPVDGDVSLCLHCGTAATWADGTSRLVPLDETALDPDDRARLAMARQQIARRYS